MTYNILKWFNHVPMIPLDATVKRITYLEVTVTSKEKKKKDIRKLG